MARRILGAVALGAAAVLTLTAARVAVGPAQPPRLAASVASAGLPAGAPVGPAGPVLPPLEDSGSAVPASVDEALSGPLSSPALGGSVGAVVVDVATGRTVFERDTSTPRSTASTQKILSALAVLDALGPEQRITTTVTWDPASSTLTLVGAGDPSLSSVAAEGSSLAALADQVVEQVEAGPVTLAYDTSLFDGPVLGPGWPEDYPALGIAAPVTALVVDRARLPGSEQREENPAAVAAAAFAAQLVDRGYDVSVADDRPATGQVIASTESVPLAIIVEQMLTDSDNDAAEMLAHLAGAALTGKGSFASGSQAIVATVSGLGIDTTGMVAVDGSGLSYQDVVPARLLADVLDLLSGPDAPAWAWPVLPGLAVAGFTGTLDDRFRSPETFAGAGAVRAKTGTLSGISTLAGTVVDADGQLFAFAFMSDGADDIFAAREALDQAAAALAECGCG